MRWLFRLIGAFFSFLFFCVAFLLASGLDLGHHPSPCFWSAMVSDR